MVEGVPLEDEETVGDGKSEALPVAHALPLPDRVPEALKVGGSEGVPVPQPEADVERVAREDGLADTDTVKVGEYDSEGVLLTVEDAVGVDSDDALRVEHPLLLPDGSPVALPLSEGVPVTVHEFEAEVVRLPTEEDERETDGVKLAEAETEGVLLTEVVTVAVGRGDALSVKLAL